MKKLFFTFLIVFGCLLAVNWAKASDLSQNTKDTQSNLTTSLYNGFMQTIHQDFSNIDNIVFSLSSQAATSVCSAIIRQCTATTSDSYCDLINSAWSDSPKIITSSQNEYVFDFASSGISFGTGYYYQIGITNCQNYYVYGSNNTTSYASGSCATADCGNVADAYFKINYGNSCSDWTDFANCIWEGNPVYPTGNTGTGVCYWDAAYNNGAGRCIDNFNNAGLTFGVGDTTDFYPSAPADCQFTLASTITTTTIAFPSQGIFQNAVYYTGPAEGEITYTDLNIYFYGSQGTTSIYHIPGYAAPNSAVGWATDSISLEKDNYRIEYKAEGYDGKGQYQTFTHYCSGTGVGYSTVGSSTLDWYGTGNQLCTYSDCSTTSWSGLDRLWCETQNLALKFICPSPAALSKARGAVASFKNRFPLNYIYLVSDFFASSSATSTIATSTATSTYMAADITNIGTGLSQFSFFANIKLIFSFLLVLIFCLWLIRWSSKVFS